MTLSKAQLRAAAWHARKLAMECVNGTAPEFGWWFKPEKGLPCCPIGKVAARARISPFKLASGGGEDVWWPPERTVSEANGLSLTAHAEMPHRERILRLPFPLLFFADELENAAEPQKDLP